MNSFLVVFLGAGLGGAGRHGANVLAMKVVGAGSRFPVGTLTVNVVGAFVLGLLAGWFALKTDPGQQWRLFLTTGILGGFTTFSAFSLETALMIERNAHLTASAYVLSSVILSVGGLLLGQSLVRYLA